MELMKLSIKLGPLEVACEGSEVFVEKHLANLIERLSVLEVRNIVLPDAGPLRDSEVDASDDQVAPRADSRSRLSTTDFAVKMGAKSGTDLVMAAAAYLHHTKGVEDLRRADLLTEMKAAKAFYRSSYGSNLSKSLETLTKSGRLQNPRAETYSLPYAEIENTKRLLQ
jgi:hypothetical protein